MWAWLKSVTGRSTATVKAAREFGLSLVANFMANALWLIAADFPSLARKAYGSNAVVYSCLRLLSQSIGEPPLVSYVATPDGEPDKPLPHDHPLRVLIRRPNELMTEFEMMELIELHNGIVGASYWWKQRTHGGMIAALWPLRPDRMTPIYSTSDKDGERVLAGWAYHPPGGGQPRPISRNDVVVFGSPDPSGETGGIVETLGPSQVLASEIAADNEATTFVGALLANYAQPSMLIKTKTPIRDPDVARRLKHNFMAELGGSHKGEPALLDAETEIEKLSFDLHQLEFPDVRSIAESRIAAAFGVPAVLVGLKVGLDRATYNNVDGMREFFADTTLSVKWRRYADQFTNDVASEFGPNIICRFDTTKVKALAEQRSKAIAPVREAFALGAVTLAQYVEVIGQALPDGVDGDVYYVPNAVTVVTAKDLGTPPPAPPAPIIQQVHHALPPGDGTGEQPPQIQDGKESPTKALKADLSAGVERRANRTRQKHVVAFERQMMEHLAGMRNHVVQAFHEAAKALPNPDDLIRPADDEVLLKLIRERWEMILADAADDAAEYLGLSFDLPNDWVQDVLDDVAERVQGIGETTRASIQHLISQAAAEGLSIPEIAEALRTCAAFSDARAETIARTETAQAYNRGTLKSYGESGLVSAVEVLDGDYDATCAGLNGSKQTLEWANANLIQHPRCTRAFAPILDSGS